MSTTIKPWPLVKEGDNQHPVQSVQYLLHQRGHPVTIDGSYGPKTTAAVKAFQAQKKLAQDGQVGPLTWAQLAFQVKEGASGYAVRGVQEEFVFRKQKLAIDGIFGPNTDAAVKGFEKGLGLQQDGFVSDQIWQALVSGMLPG
ncbi:MAG: peptidoglycan-binding domain-containing protein [Streptosporangiaceae bacterium]